MKKRNIFKIIFIVSFILFLVFWITAFIKACPRYSTLDVYGVINPDYEDNIYDKIFDRVCPVLVKLKLISFTGKATAVGLFNTDLNNLKNGFPNLVKAYEKN